MTFSMCISSNVRIIAYRKKGTVPKVQQIVILNLFGFAELKVQNLFYVIISELQFLKRVQDDGK